MSLTGQKPYSSPYPRELATWGDHLRARRLERGLLQKDLAREWRVDTATVNYWERNRFAPAPRHLPRVVEFLGYVPYNPHWTPAERIRAQRETLGFSRQRFALALGVHEGTVRRWEWGWSEPSPRLQVRVQAFLQPFFSRDRGSDEDGN